MTDLDTTAIAQAPMLAQAIAQSASTAVPDNSGSHRFEPLAGDADWNNGLVVNMAVEFFIGGQSVYKIPSVNVAPAKAASGTVEAPHFTLNFPFDPRIGQPVFVLWGNPAIDTQPDPRAVPIVGASTVVTAKPSISASVGVRQCAAPTFAQLPAPIAAPVLTVQTAKVGA
jgi:hypothetical protein